MERSILFFIIVNLLLVGCYPITENRSRTNVKTDYDPDLREPKKQTIVKFPGFPGAVWQEKSPLLAGWSEAKLLKAKRQFLKMGATGLVIVHKGKIIAKWGDVQRRVNCHSVRKSLISALYGIYVGEKKIDITKTLKQLGIEDKSPLSEEEKSASIRNLLMARSGVYHPAALETKTMKRKRPLRGSHKPGSFWYYNNWDFNLLGSILEQETGKSIFQAFYDKIARPLRMEHYSPEDGKYIKTKLSRYPGYSFYLSTLDRARFGLLFLHNGRWGNRQIIPKKWIKESTTPYSITGKGIGYGYLWWVSTGQYHLAQKIVGKAYSARGNWGQFIIVLPQHKIVIAQSKDRSLGGPKCGGKPFRKLFRLIMAAAPKIQN